MKLKYLLYLAAVLVTAGGLRATTVIPPTFEQLVKQAEFIFQGTVTDVHSMWDGEGAQRRIHTYVTLLVTEPMKGLLPSTYTIRLLGGTVGDETEEVADAPVFHVGDREILFVEHNLQQFVPLVGINYGRFHLQRTSQTGHDILVTGENEQLRDVTSLGHLDKLTNNTEAISPDVFKAAIRQQLPSTN